MQVHVKRRKVEAGGVDHRAAHICGQASHRVDAQAHSVKQPLQILPASTAHGHTGNAIARSRRDTVNALQPFKRLFNLAGDQLIHLPCGGIDIFGRDPDVFRRDTGKAFDPDRQGSHHAQKQDQRHQQIGSNRIADEPSGQGVHSTALRDAWRDGLPRQKGCQRCDGQAPRTVTVRRMDHDAVGAPKYDVGRQAQEAVVRINEPDMARARQGCLGDVECSLHPAASQDHADKVA